MNHHLPTHAPVEQTYRWNNTKGLSKQVEKRDWMEVNGMAI